MPMGRFGLEGLMFTRCEFPAAWITVVHPEDTNQEEQKLVTCVSSVSGSRLSEALETR